MVLNTTSTNAKIPNTQNEHAASVYMDVEAKGNKINVDTLA